MPATTAYGVDLLVELAVGRAADAGLWGAGAWGRARWAESDTDLGDWLDVSCDLLDELRMTAGSNTSDGVTRRWESATASFKLLGPQWDPWNGPHARIIGDRTPTRISWRPAYVPFTDRVNLFTNPQAVTIDATSEPVSFDGHAGLNILTGSDGSTMGARGAAKWTATGTANQRMILLYQLARYVQYTVRFDIRTSYTTGGASGGAVAVYARPTASSSTGQVLLATTVDLTANRTRTLEFTFTVTNTPTATAGIVLVRQGGAVVGEVTEITRVTFEAAPTSPAFFDGSTPDTPHVTYAWTGAPDASSSSAVGAPVQPWVPAFTGFVATRGYSWDPDEQEAAVACVDGTSVLVASDGLAQAPQGAGETAAARVARIAASALWPAALDVTPGGTPLQATTLDDPAWDELLAVADTDLALLWVNRAGALSYRPRGWVGQGTTLAGRLVVCEAGPDDVGVMTMGRHQPSVTRNRVAIARRVDETIPGDAPVPAQLEDRQSIARYQAHDFKRTDLLHRDDAWSATIAQAVLGAGAWPSPAPGELLLDTITEDPRVGPVLLTLEPDMTFDVVDDAGSTWRQAIVGWDVQLTHDGAEGVLHVEDVTRWTSAAHWGTARWGIDRWGIGGI
jgi:hypothetical protein